MFKCDRFIDQLGYVTVYVIEPIRLLDIYSLVPRRERRIVVSPIQKILYLANQFKVIWDNWGILIVIRVMPQNQIQTKDIYDRQLEDLKRCDLIIGQFQILNSKTYGGLLFFILLIIDRRFVVLKGLNWMIYRYLSHCFSLPIIFIDQFLRNILLVFNS